MKKIWKYAILLVALSALLCMSAFAVDSPDCPDVTILDETNANVWVKAGYESFTATYNAGEAAAGSQYLIIMLAGTETGSMPDPTKTKILYVNQDAAGEDGVVSFETVYPMALEDSVIWLTGGTDGPVALASVKAPKKQGVTVSGTVTSYLTGDATVELVKDGETIKTATGAAYEFTEVAAGIYTLKVSKTNHVTREYTITVGETAVTQDAKICPLGDVTGDGKVNSRDLNKLYAHINETGIMSGYEFKCGDVQGNNDIVNTRDYNRLYAHVNETNFLW